MSPPGPKSLGDAKMFARESFAANGLATSVFVVASICNKPIAYITIRFACLHRARPLQKVRY